MTDFIMPDFAAGQCTALETYVALQAGLWACNLQQVDITWYLLSPEGNTSNEIDVSDLTAAQVVYETSPNPQGTVVEGTGIEVHVEAGANHTWVSLPDYGEASDLAWVLPMITLQEKQMGVPVTPCGYLWVTDGIGSELPILTQTGTAAPNSTIEFTIDTPQRYDPSQPPPPPASGPQFVMPDFAGATLGGTVSALHRLQQVNNFVGSVNAYDPKGHLIVGYDGYEVVSTSPAALAIVSGGDIDVNCKAAATSPVVLPNLEGLSLRDAMVTAFGVLWTDTTIPSPTPQVAVTLKVTSPEGSVVIGHAPPGQVGTGPLQVVVVNPSR